MNNKDPNPIEELLQDLISRRKSSASFFEEFDNSSFVKEFLDISASKLNDSVRELVTFLNKTLNDESVKEFSRRIDRARISTPDKRALMEGVYISENLSHVIEWLGRQLDTLGGKSENLRREIDFLIHSFDELKTYAGKDLAELTKEYKDLIGSLREAGFGLEEFLINEVGGIRQFGRYFYLSKLEPNKYREESYLISQPEFFRSVEHYARFFGPEALFKSSESLIKRTIEDMRLSSSMASFLSEVPIRERIFNPDIPTITDFQRTLFKRIPQEISQAKQFANTGLLELNERINTLLKVPESERDYITLSKLVTQREELQKRLLSLMREEVEFRQEFNRRTYGMFLEASKDFGLKAVDKIFATTRNPFVDIFTESLRFGMDIGTRVYSGTRNLLDLVPGGGPGRGASRPPTGPNKPKGGTPTEEPATTSPKPNTPIPPILRGTGRLVRGAAGFSIGYLFGVGEDVLLEHKSLKEALTSPSNIGSGIGTAVGMGLGSFLGPLGTFVGGALGSYAGSYIGSLFEKNKGDTSNKEAAFSIAQSSLQNLGLVSSMTSLSIKELGLSAKNLNINLGELLKTGGALAAGGISFGGAFLSDFYLQSMNKAYDIYYQQFSQQNLMPQVIRRQLGLTTAEISRNLITPGTGLLYQGPLSVAGLGFERTELLAGASRVSNQMLVRSAEDLAGRLKEAANIARIFGTNLEQGVEAVALLRKATLNYADLFTTSYALTRTEPTAFTKAMAEAVIQASLSLSIQQGANPRQYLESFERAQTLFITSSNKTLAELAKNNIEITRNFVNSFNEFIRGGLNNPIAGGIGIRAGLTPREMLLGATPENMTRVIRELSLELGLPGSLVGGRFSGQAREYLLPLIQNLLGLTNISPDAFNEIVLSVITGRDAQAQKLLREAQKAPLPSAIPSDSNFARNIDQLNISYQQLTDVLERNISAITELNKAINNLAAKVIDAGDTVIPFILSKMGEVLKEIPDTNKYSTTENQGPPLVSKEMIDKAESILSSSTFPYSGYALVKIEKVPEPITKQLIETIAKNANKKGGK